MYNDTVMDHFNHPRNVGAIENCSAFIQGANEICGHTVFFYLNIKDNVIIKLKYKMFGCAVAIAACSMLSIMVENHTVEEAKNFTTARLIDALDGVPEYKHYCIQSIMDHFQEAIRIYEEAK